MQTPSPRTLSRMCLLLACAIALSGCAQIVADQEKLLDTAGFTAQPTNTPQRQAALSSLPPHEFVRKVQGTEITYTYADPLVCHCLYIGSDLAYLNYLHLAVAGTSPTGSTHPANARAVSLSNWYVNNPMR